METLGGRESLFTSTVIDRAMKEAVFSASPHTIQTIPATMQEKKLKMQSD